MCYRYAIANGQKTFATGIRKWSRHLNDFPTPKFTTRDCIQQWLSILTDIYTYLCVTDMAFKYALLDTGPHPFTLQCLSPWGSVPSDPDTCPRTDLASDVLINVRVLACSDRLTANRWLSVQRHSRPAREMCIAHWLSHSWVKIKGRCSRWEHRPLLINIDR